MNISLIWAQGRNGEIGLDNRLPWREPEELMYFQGITMGSIVVMGGKTYRSLKGPLKGRNNVVITRDPEPVWVPPGVAVYRSIPLLLKDIGNHKVFVIGGGEIFDLFMRFADTLYVSVIDKDYKADTFAPSYSKSDFELVETNKINDYINGHIYRRKTK